jgi:hypothetical protein
LLFSYLILFLSAGLCSPERRAPWPFAPAVLPHCSRIHPHRCAIRILTIIFADRAQPLPPGPALPLVARADAQGARQHSLRAEQLWKRALSGDHLQLLGGVCCRHEGFVISCYVSACVSHGSALHLVGAFHAANTGCSYGFFLRRLACCSVESLGERRGVCMLNHALHGVGCWTCGVA